MKRPDYSKTLAGAVAEFSKTLKERDRLSARLVQLLGTIRATEALMSGKNDREEYIRDLERSSMAAGVYCKCRCGDSPVFYPGRTLA